MDYYDIAFYVGIPLIEMIQIKLSISIEEIFYLC